MKSSISDPDSSSCSSSKVRSIELFLHSYRRQKKISSNDVLDCLQLLISCSLFGKVSEICVCVTFVKCCFVEKSQQVNRSMVSPKYCIIFFSAFGMQNNFCPIVVI